MALAMTVALAAGVPVSAVTVSNTWQAKIGTAGANGSAKVQAFGSGTGSLVLKVAKLKRSSLLAVVISKGTCGSVGSTVATLASIRTNSTGAAARTYAMTVAQVTAINTATRAAGRIAIRVGSGTTRKCGLFAVPAPTVGATITVGVDPENVAIDATGIWVTNFVDSTISRIDPKTNTVLAVTPLPDPSNAYPFAVTSGFGSIWVTMAAYDETATNDLPGSVLRINPAAGTVIGNPIPVGKYPAMIAASADALWVTNETDGTVSRIDPTTNTVTATITVGGLPFGVVAAFGSIWVTNESDGHVDRIDPATNQVTGTVQTLGNAEGIAAGAGSLWVANYGTLDQPNGTVSRIDPVLNSVVASIPVGTNPLVATFGGGYVWIAMSGEPNVVQIDPLTNAVKKRVAVGAESWGVVASDHAVWVAHPTAAGADPNANVPGTVTRINF